MHSIVQVMDGICFLECHSHAHTKYGLRGATFQEISLISGKKNLLRISKVTKKIIFSKFYLCHLPFIPLFNMWHLFMMRGGTLKFYNNLLINRVNVNIKYLSVVNE